MATTDLHPCVKAILCGLSDSALRTIQALIDGQVALIRAQITIYQAQLLQYDILSIPIQATKVAAQAIIDKAKSSSYLIPLNVVTGCVDLGDFKVNIMDTLNIATATLDDVVFEATRLLSYRDELNAIVNELNAAITQFTDIRAIIDECLAGD
jgi:hypothetical protein